MIITNGVYEFSLISFTMKREQNKINTIKLGVTSNAIYIEDEVDIKHGLDIVFHGFVTEKKQENNGTYTYTVAQHAAKLKKYRVSKDGSYNVKITTDTSVNDIVTNYILPSDWSIEAGSSDTTTLKGINFYYINRLSGLYKVLNNIREHNIWFDDANKKVGFGTNWHDLTATDITSYIRKLGTEQAMTHNVDQVIVIGSSEAIKGIYPKTGIPVEPELVVFQYNELGSNDEADALAKKLYTDYGEVKTRITLELKPTFEYNETDLVKVDGVNYTVYDVEVTYSKTTLGLSSGRETIYDLLGDALKEVTGETALAMATTYDGGLQNIGAPYINDIVTVDTASNTILVENSYANFPVGTIVRVESTGTLPEYLHTTTNYIVKTSNYNTLTLMFEENGGTILINSLGSGDHYIIRVDNGIKSKFHVVISSNSLILETNPNVKRYKDGDRILFSSTGSFPGGIASILRYHVINADNSSFQIYYTNPSEIKDITSDGSGILRCRNLESQSLPAIYDINIPDVNNIDNYNLECDFDYFKEGMSIGDEVEFLSKPTHIVDKREHISGYYNYTHSYEPRVGYVEYETECTPISTGFQDGLLTFSGTLDFTYRPMFSQIIFQLQCELTYPDGSKWTSEVVDFDDEIATEDDSYAGKKVYTTSFLLEGNDLEETSSSPTKLKLYTTLYCAYLGYYTYGAQYEFNNDVNLDANIIIARTPKHKHTIGKSYNPAGSVYPSFVYSKISNIDLIDEYLHLGSVKPLTSTIGSRNLTFDPTNKNNVRTFDLIVFKNAPAPFVDDKIYLVDYVADNYMFLMDKETFEYIIPTEVRTDIEAYNIGHYGTISGKKKFNIQDQLATGLNRITMYSETPGSVYVTGTYNNYGI